MMATATLTLPKIKTSFFKSTTTATAAALAKNDEKNKQQSDDNDEVTPKSNKNKIPIVQHLIRDDDIVSTRDEILEPIDFDRAIKLFVDKHSMNLKNRHFHIIKKIVKCYHLGFVSYCYVFFFIRK